MRLALALAVAAVVAAIGLVTERGGEPSVAARAYAALAPSTGIMHFVAEYPPATDGSTRPREGEPSVYTEYWIDRAHPRRKRIVTTIGGAVVGQVVFVDRRVPNGGLLWSRHPRTYILTGPRKPPVFWLGGPGGVDEGKDPIAVYRELLRGGVVESEREITYDGRDAVELKIVYKPPYDFVDDIWTGDRQTYIVDRHTYFPLESVFQLDPTFGGGASTTRYPEFEILPSTAQNRKLLGPVGTRRRTTRRLNSPVGPFSIAPGRGRAGARPRPARC